MKKRASISLSILVCGVVTIAALGLFLHFRSAKTDGSQTSAKPAAVDAGKTAQKDPNAVSTSELLRKLEERRKAEKAAGKPRDEGPSSDTVAQEVGRQLLENAKQQALGRAPDSPPPVDVAARVKLIMEKGDSTTRLNTLYQIAKNLTYDGSKILEEILFGNDVQSQKDLFGVLSDFDSPYFLNLVVRLRDKTQNEEIKTECKATAQKISAKIALKTLEQKKR